MRLVLRSSWQLLAFFLALYLLVLAAIFASMAPLWLKIIAAAILLIHAYYVLVTKVFLTSPKSIVNISPEKNGQWRLGFNQGDDQQASLCGHSFISRYAMILSFIPDPRSKRLSVLLVPAMLGQENFRQLLVYCRVMRK